MHVAHSIARTGWLLLFAVALACSSPSQTTTAPTPPPADQVSEPPAPPPATDTSGDTGPDDSGDAPVSAGTDVATGKQGAVTSAEAHASKIGLDILQKGGNAVDAAVAVGFALSVTHPSAGNIGGGGFMVIRLPDGQVTAIDYRETAPGKASRNMYLDKQGNPTNQSRLGPLAAGIPGNVAGFAYAHKKYGSLPWKDLIAPAIALAKDGHTLDEFHATDLGWGLTRIGTFRDEVKGRKGKKGRALAAALDYTAKLFRGPDGQVLKTGDTWVQSDQAATLQLIADKGPDAFYKGPLANKMAAEVRKMGGIWTAKDLAQYKAVERKPIVFEYQGYRIVTMPPPSAGGVTLRQIFAASDILGLGKMKWDSIDRVHLYVEALRRVYADRNKLIADPDFVEVPLDTLLDIDYLRERMADVDHKKATPSSKVGAGIELQEKPQTTHYSVVDKSRMAVANTYTLNGGFGAKVAIPGTGVILNNEMDDFTAKVGAPNMFGLVQGPQNAIAPKKRMVSSMTPTIVTKDDKLRVVCGSPGGPTITTTVAQVLLQVIDHQTPIDKAIANTRIHHQWLPDQIFHEASLSEDVAAALQKRGHTLESRGRIGHANCIEADPASGTLRAVADSGRDGGDAVAY